ncbi:hypothetical protein POM88_015616 [Heracleum sosnowskyi]|uniref:Myosin motor domain-containing protein n=1 Tax=Heracleum sosnowskyi TaxID=360622 RepID=A0AAD8MXK7_9APIA|nr:hypothetical protein POM88_015616 [Heracleum sosnowskyi]
MPEIQEKLNLKSANEYKYLSQSNCYSISGVDDAEEFRVVVEALDVVHVSKEDQEKVFAMLAAVLWLGNVSFTVIDNENHVEPVVDEGNNILEYQSDMVHFIHSISTVSCFVFLNISEQK